ncbi:hypothetical protein [Acetobacter sp. DmW_136]|uniref:hypothetical protein n=1 Tax=Acetobacter sp. DmW_136 TaxID=2591091 RepID=UPI001EE38A24|nr:hypothetical protein [Acetobacter sp. DmW_136]
MFVLLHAEENSQRPDLAFGDIPPDRGFSASSDGNAGDPEYRTTPPSNLDTATKRRAEVVRILQTAEGMRMPLRAIAQMAGVSPTTVGNIKRRMTRLG